MKFDRFLNRPYWHDIIFPDVCGKSNWITFASRSRITSILMNENLPTYLIGFTLDLYQTNRYSLNDLLTFYLTEPKASIIFIGNIVEFVLSYLRFVLITSYDFKLMETFINFLFSGSRTYKINCLLMKYIFLSQFDRTVCNLKSKNRNWTPHQIVSFYFVLNSIVHGLPYIFSYKLIFIQFSRKINT